MGEESISQNIEQPNEEKHRLWPVAIDEKGEIVGLPKEVSANEVILFKESDGRWWAANPSPDILEEIRMWRTDWQ